MLQASQFRLLIFYLWGFWLVFLQAIVFSVLIMWGIQAIAFAAGEVFDWGAVLHHLILSLTFIAFYPGQQFWTFRMEDPDGVIHTIIGAQAEPEA